MLKWNRDVISADCHMKMARVIHLVYLIPHFIYLRIYFQNDYDMVEWLNELREGIIEAYSGIIQGLKGDDQVPNPDIALLEPHIPHIVQFLSAISQDPIKNESIISVSGGLVG